MPIGAPVNILETEEGFACERGNSFVVSSKVITLNSVNPHLFLYFKNTDPVKKMKIWVVWFGWNGGSANQDKVLKWGWVIAPNEPTANHTQVTPGNLNFQSSNPAQALVYKWDGVGDGMTYTGGIIPSEALFNRGYTPIIAHGIPILGENDAFGMLFTGEEIGEAVFTMRFYYK